MNLNKAELVDKMAESAGITKKDAEKALNAMISAVEVSLAMGGKVAIAGFGAWSVSERGARKGRNPKTGEEIDIPASKAPVFKAGAKLKEVLK